MAEVKEPGIEKFAKELAMSRARRREILEPLRRLFAFGVPGGKTKVQKAIGRYLDGDGRALDKMPAIKRHIDQAVVDIKKESAKGPSARGSRRTGIHMPRRGGFPRGPGGGSAGFPRVK